MRSALLTVLVTALACGPTSSTGSEELLVDQSGAVPLQISATASVDHLSGLATIAARIANTSRAGVTIRVRCTPIELDRSQGASWQRIEDLRLCAPPDRTLVPPRATLQVDDIRQVEPGDYRVTIELIDGRQAFSPTFTISPIR